MNFYAAPKQNHHRSITLCPGNIHHILQFWINSACLRTIALLMRARVSVYVRARPPPPKRNHVSLKKTTFFSTFFSLHHHPFTPGYIPSKAAPVAARASARHSAAIGSCMVAPRARALSLRHPAAGGSSARERRGFPRHYREQPAESQLDSLHERWWLESSLALSPSPSPTRVTLSVFSPRATSKTAEHAQERTTGGCLDKHTDVCMHAHACVYIKSYVFFLFIFICLKIIPHPHIMAHL